MTRSVAIGKSAAEIQRQISSIQEDIAKVETCEKDATQYAALVFDDLDREIKNSFEGTKRALEEEIQRYFSAGKAREKEAYDAFLKEQRKRREERRKNPLIVAQKWLFPAAIKPSEAPPDFDPKNPVLERSSKEEAQKLKNKIVQAVSSTIKTGEQNVRNAIGEAIADFDENFTQTVYQSAEKILKELTDRLGKAGLNLHFELPRVGQLALKVNGAELLDGLIAEREKSVPGSRRKEGLWAGFLNWCNDDWGKESYQSTQTYYTIDTRQIKTKVLGDLNRALDGLDKQVAAEIKKPIDDTIHRFFADFKGKVEAIRADLIQGMQDKKRSHDEQQQLLKRLDHLKKTIMPFLGRR